MHCLECCLGLITQVSMLQGLKLHETKLSASINVLASVINPKSLLFIRHCMCHRSR